MQPSRCKDGIYYGDFVVITFDIFSSIRQSGWNTTMTAFITLTLDLSRTWIVDKTVSMTERFSHFSYRRNLQPLDKWTVL